MAADISKMSFGRDQAGINKAKSYIKERYDVLIAFLDKNRVAAAEPINVIRNNWVGADAEAFINSYLKDLESLKDVAKQVYNAEITLLDQAYNDFLSFQNKN